MSTQHSVDLRWTGDMEFMALTSSGHTMTLDEATGSGGHSRGPLPAELLIIGLAGCTAMDVLSMLKEKQQEVISYEVRVRAQRREEDPRIFTSAAIEHVVTGRVEGSQLAHAIERSETRYCSAFAMLSPPLEVTTSHRIIAPDG